MQCREQRLTGLLETLPVAFANVVLEEQIKKGQLIVT
jgi:hypothetical protein